MFACRTAEKAEAAVEKVLKERDAALCDTLEIDLCSLHSVKNAAARFKQKYK